MNPSGKVAVSVGRTTEFSSGAGCKDFLPRKAVVGPICWNGWILIMAPGDMRKPVPGIGRVRGEAPVQRGERKSGSSAHGRLGYARCTKDAIDLAERLSA